MLPLRAIRVFEVVARHESIKLAAEELHLTPGAVGQQIKLLESWLGVELFRRHAKMIRITDLGRDYYSRVMPALGQIETASRNLQGRRKNVVSISVVPSLASRWLVGWLEHFILDNPEIDITIEASTRLVNFERESFDMAIRYFDGNDPSLEQILLCGGQGLALCTPEYRDRLGLAEPNDLLRATLLQTVLHADWSHWLGQHTSLSAAQQQSIRAIRFNQITLAIDAAKQNMGIVLTSPLLVQNEIRDGTLVEPFEKRVELPRKYYLVHPATSKLSPPSLRLKAWITEQFLELRKTGELD